VCFSSRRRHTRFSRDWSSDVCSSDLWRVVEPEGQRAAGEWTREDEERLRAIVDDARRNGLWIRFYTLNGHDGEGDGWFASYNFEIGRAWRREAGASAVRPGPRAGSEV